jgi:hypothetical protein
MSNGEAEELINSISPVHFVNSNSCASILVYGEQDQLVSQTHHEKLTTALEGAGVDYILIIFPNSGHGLENDSDKYEEYINTVNTYMNKCFGSRTEKSCLFIHVFERYNHVKVVECVDIAVDQPGHLLELCNGPFFLCKRQLISYKINHPPSGRSVINMAKDGTNRGGARIGSGQKKRFYNKCWGS